MQINNSSGVNFGNGADSTVNSKKLLGYLGLARKEGMLAFGTESVMDAVRGGLKGGRKPYIVLLASDASANTKKRIENGCAYYRIQCRALPVGSDMLGHAIGKAGCIAAVGLMDEGFARAVEKCLERSG